MLTIHDLQDKHKGEPCYIVGTGPSLMEVKENDFGPGPIITIHNAIYPVLKLGLDNPIYSQWRDELNNYDELENARRLTVPRLVCKNSTWGVVSCADQLEGYVFDCSEDWGADPKSMFSHKCACLIALMTFGASHLVMVGFDSVMGDYKNLNRHGEVVGEDIPGSFKDQIQHMVSILDGIKGLPTVWFFPEARTN